MKRLLVLLLLSAAMSASAADVDITLKNGKKVTGGVLAEDADEIVILVQASNGVYRKSINKTDIAVMKERAPAKPVTLGPKDVERLQKKIKAAGEELRRREMEIPKAQQALDDFYRARPNTMGTATQRTLADNQEKNLRTRLTTARTQAEIARSKLNALYNDLEEANKKTAESPQRLK